MLRGAGTHFCAGADLRELSQAGPSSLLQLLSRFREVTSRFETSPLLVVAAAQGAARAGGLELLLACDAVIATTDATMGDAHLANGLLPGGGARSEEHTSELQSLMRISYAVLCLKQKKKTKCRQT